VPLHLRNAPAKGMAELGYGVGYKYAHDYPGHIVDQDYLPADIAGTIYYDPSQNGYESKVSEWLKQRRKHTGTNPPDSPRN